MKKLLSILLCFTMLFGVFCAFSVSASDDTPYSGGRGTEDDPYLISTPDDVREINQNIVNDPSLWSRKVYYKLTEDITVDCKISPLYETRGPGLSCFTKSGYTFESFSYGDLNDSEESYMQICEREGSLYAVSVDETRHGWVYDYYLEMKTFERLHELAYSYSNPWPDYGYIKKDLYRKAAFTGSFDGDGHTIFLGDRCEGYLFGCLENGADVKNLTVKGKNAGIAYSVSKDSQVFACILDSDWMYDAKAVIGGGLTDDDQWGYRYDIVSGAIAYNDGTVENCVNYSDGISGLVGNNEGTVKNCMNLSSVIVDYEAEERISRDVKQLLVNRSELDDCAGVHRPSELGIQEGISSVDLANSSYSIADDTLYTLDECIAAGGDKSAFAGLDFIYTWVMIEGMPYLRFACEGMAGDINFDGTVNAKDANQLKTVLTLGIEGHDYRMIASFDVNIDESVNAKDSNLLKQNLAGIN